MQKLVVIVLAILTAAISAHAQDSEEDSEFARPGPYVQIGLSAAVYPQLEDEIEDLAVALGYVPEVEVEYTMGGNVRAGYRIHPWVAAELTYEYLAVAEAELDGSDFANIRTWAFTGNVKVFPFHGRFQPFLLAGFGAVNQRIRNGGDSEDTVAAGRFGLGFDVYEGRNFALSIDTTYLLPFGDPLKDGGDLISVTLGLKFRP
jgi:opacity protein-like surface antigen